MGRARKDNELARARAERRRSIDQAYNARHPQRAAVERGFRQDRAALAKLGNYREATPETIAKARRAEAGALARLCNSGAISADQLAWSAEIRQVHERIVRGVTIGSISFEGRVDNGRGDGQFFEALGAVWAEVAYSRWRADLPRPAPVLAMIVEDRSCRAAALLGGATTRTALRLLCDALDAWPHYHREAREAIDREDLQRAHARLVSK